MNDELRQLRLKCYPEFGCQVLADLELSPEERELVIAALRDRLRELRRRAEKARRHAQALPDEMTMKLYLFGRERQWLREADAVQALLERIDR